MANEMRVTAGGIREGSGEMRAGVITKVVAFLFIVIALPAIASLSLPATFALSTEEAGTLFQAKCSSCHTIGGGKRVGPDLQGVTDRRDQAWLLEFITAPDQVIASGDPVATRLVEEYGLAMPNLGIAQEEAEGLLAYIEAQSGGPPSRAAPPSPAPPSGPSPAGDAAIGKDLFTGKRSLANGGPACIACHSVGGIGTLGGGTLALDLTEAYSKFGEEGLTSVLASPPFPVMREIFVFRPLTPEEATHLKAFLWEVSQKGAVPGVPSSNFLLVGVGFFVLFLLLSQVIWRRRLRGVRVPLVGGDAK
jgi:mono/diheme cytochrome c family protein